MKPIVKYYNYVFDQKKNRLKNCLATKFYGELKIKNELKELKNHGDQFNSSELE